MVTRRVVLGGLVATTISATVSACSPTAGDTNTEEESVNTPTRYDYGTHPAQFGELTLPTGTPRALVVLIHGGFWRAQYDLELGRPLAVDLVARGYSVFNLEYRRVGDGGGWPATLDDVAAGIDLLAELPGDLPLTSVITIGHSAGGHLAVWAASRPDAAVAITGAISQAGVLDLATAAHDEVGSSAVTDLVGGTPAQVPDRYALADPIARLPIGVPVRCVHAPADDLVPIEQSEAYVAAATAAGDDATLVTASGDHFTVIDPVTPDWALCVAELDALVV